MTTPIFDQAHLKIIEITFSFPEFTKACKKSVHSINSFLWYSQFYSPVTRLATPISDHAQPKIFWSIFNLCEFVSTWKKSGYFIDLFWRYGDLKILQSDWLRTFWLVSQEPEFSQIWDLCRNTASNRNFHYRTNIVKINGNIFQYTQKLLFLAHFCLIFPIFEAKKIFSEKSGSATHNFIWVSSSMPKFRKN